MNHQGLSKWQLTAIIIGNVLEWYDFVVFSFMLVFISRLFFPSQDPLSALLSTTATFGISFCLRPLGGVIFGLFADRYGSKSAMLVIIGLMAFATFLIVCTPTYRDIGIYATYILIIARMLQGLATSGEFGTAINLLIRMAPEKERYFYSSWQMFGQLLALAMGTVVGLLMTVYFTTETIENWAWRLPFLLGLLIMPVGILLRKTFKHSASSLIEKNALNPKFWDLAPFNVICGMGLVAGASVPLYLIINYMPTYAHLYLHFSLNEAYFCCFSGLCAGLISVFFGGKLADRINPVKLAILSLSGQLILAFPLYSYLLLAHQTALFALIQIIMTALMGFYLASFAPMIADLFPEFIQTTGISVSYNFSVMLFGGFAPFIVTWLIQSTGSPLAMLAYLMTGLSLALIVCLSKVMIKSQMLASSASG
ncbi:hypothetical protein B1207_00125 [Legionella quinlivanii]|uniref:Major facilitator superfamily (MFS) profile domain-containing protein n=1 Tax=Legionella quinlivanii TaxID=45073 RepID=A0A364LMP9_9GAMM|nr:MFS transporter [Legionella quinlivanii]RAP38334.1 hypothetical protein B1207_00125 [Legionella quinlivanii]